MLRWLRAGILGLGLLTYVTTSHAIAEEQPPIKFGFSVAMTGFWLAYDGDGTKMAQVFMDDVNAKGGILGRKIAPLFADTKGDRAEGAKAGQEVISEGADLVFVTCDYDFGAPAALQAQKAGKISVFLCAEDPKAGIVGVGPYSFSASAAAQVQGATIAEWAYKEKNVRLGVFFDVGNVWGPGEKIKGSDLRASTGLAVSWDSPVGPLRFSFGAPIKSKTPETIPMPTDI